MAADTLQTPVRAGTTRFDRGDAGSRPLGVLDGNRLADAINPPLRSASAAGAGNAVKTPEVPLKSQVPQPQAQQQDKRRKKVKPSSLCLTPPSIIQNNAGQSYQRGSCIGEGGFARCFQVNDGNGEIYAAKTLAKAALENEKTRSKLLTEIKIHQAMRHRNIVQYIDSFEDSKNVYVLLEMCSNQSLADMVHHRRNLSETEARFFFVQLLGAVAYMHYRGIVHRDLKLGNIFIDKDMNLKVGDFGLAASVGGRHHRRYTVCGTPNYISPEVLKRPHAHGLSTDIWALGVILYAMIVGRPPFQERDVDQIYQRIKHHEVCFPPAPSASLAEARNRVSPEARDFVAQLLHPDPEQRPSIQECLDHPWLHSGTFVSTIPMSALSSNVYLYATPQESAANFQNAVRLAGLDELRKVAEKAPATTIVSVSATEIEHTSSQKVLPNSISPPSTKDKYHAVAVPAEAVPDMQQEDVPDYDSPVVGRLTQKPRENVFNNSPGVYRSSRSETADAYRPRFGFSKAPLAARTSTGAAEIKSNVSAATSGPSSLASGVPSIASSSVSARPATSGPARMQQRPTSTSVRNVVGPLRNSLRLTLNTVRGALDTHVQDSSAARRGAGGPVPPISSLSRPVEPPVFVTRWADFEENWGMAYCLSDGSVGTLFRDHTSMRMDPMFHTYVYFESRSRPGFMTQHRTAADTADPRRAKKVEVLNYVRRYMDRELGHAVEPTRVGGDVSQGEIVYALHKHADHIMFVLTDGTMQFNFKDHNKLVLYENGTKLGLITDSRQIFAWTLSDALTATRAPHFQRIRLPNKLATMYSAVREYYRQAE